MVQRLIPSPTLASRYSKARYMSPIKELGKPYPPYTSLGQQCTLCLLEPLVELQCLFCRWCVFGDYPTTPQVYPQSYDTTQLPVLYMPSLLLVLENQFILPLVLLIQWLSNLSIDLQPLFGPQCSSQLYTSLALAIYIVQDPSLYSAIGIPNLLYYP